MQLFSSLLFGVSASLDALLMGITYGIRRIHIRLWQNLLISTITLLGTCLSVKAGALLSPLLPASLGKWVGSLILIFYGFYYLMKSMRDLWKKYQPKYQISYPIKPNGSSHSSGGDKLEKAELTQELSYGNALTLGVALSANNIGIGLSASMAGLTLLPAAVMTLLFSVTFLFLGNRLGRGFLSQWIGVAADPLSGLLLILLGLWELFF